MAQAAASFGAARSGSARRKLPLSKWAAIMLIFVYSIGLPAGFLIYNRIRSAPVHDPDTGIPKSQQLGRILIVTPDGCRSGEFNNSRPTFTLSQTPCDDEPKYNDPDFAESGNARVRAIGRYFRGAN